MAPAPYQRLYNDVEEGLPLDNFDNTAHDQPFSEKLYSFARFRPSHLSQYLPTVHNFQRLGPRRWPLALVASLLLISTALVTVWFTTSYDISRLVGGIETFSNNASIILWPNQTNTSGVYPVHYTLIPLISSSHSALGPQSPPSLAPLDALETLLDPSSLPKKTSSGIKLPHHLQTFFNDPPKFDIVWTWVNGSDPLHREALAEAERKHIAQKRAELWKRSGGPLVEVSPEEVDAAIRERVSTSPKLYRDHDELRYSLRSVLQYFGPFLNSLHVVSGDFAIPKSPDSNHPYVGLPAITAGQPSVINTSESSHRLGQIPQWLRDDVDVTRVDSNTGRISLQFHHHSQFFEDYTAPTFNSFSIESQLGRLDGVAEHFVYMNDDYFFYDTLSPLDFYTPAYGIVLRFQPDLLVSSANPARDDKNGEWRPLKYSNWLLDQRYGARKRPYMVHAPKSISLSIFRELSSFRNFPSDPAAGVPESRTMGGVFREALLRTSKHTFRGQYSNVEGHDDAYVTFLFAHHVVERWREILLWSWVVGRLGGSRNEWDAAIRSRAWSELGGTGAEPEPEHPPRNEAQITVTMSTRETLDQDTVNNVLGRTGATVYAFSSLDGYPYAFLKGTAKRSWPQMTPNSQWLAGKGSNDWRPAVPDCKIDFAECFPTTLANASQAFTHVAFAKPECGDCIVRALVIASGEKGLDAFLPDPKRNVEFAKISPVADERDPFLPLDSAWSQIDFSLDKVLAPWAVNTHPTTSERQKSPQGTVNVREWTMRAMARYRFVLGETPFTFLMLRSPYTAATQLKAIGRSRPRPAMVCINDDLNSDPAGRASQTMKQWMESIWPTEAWWER